MEKEDFYRKCFLKDIALFKKIRVIGTVLKINKKDFLIRDFTSECWVKTRKREIKVGDIVEIFGEVRKRDEKVFIIAHKILKRGIYDELFRLLEILKYGKRMV